MRSLANERRHVDDAITLFCQPAKLLAGPGLLAYVCAPVRSVFRTRHRKSFSTHTHTLAHPSARPHMVVIEPGPLDAHYTRALNEKSICLMCVRAPVIPVPAMLRC